MWRVRRSSKHVTVVLAKNERLKQELQVAKGVIDKETPLLLALEEKEPWLQLLYQQPSANVIKVVTYDNYMKNQVITSKIGQWILKVVDDHQRKWDTAGKLWDMTDLLLEAVDKRK